MSEDKAVYATDAPFVAGETVYYDLHPSVPAIVRPSEGEKISIEYDGGELRHVYDYHLSRTPWPVATQCAHGFDHGTGCLLCQPATPSAVDELRAQLAQAQATIAIYEAGLIAVSDDNGFHTEEDGHGNTICRASCNQDWHNEATGTIYTHAADCKLDAALKEIERRKTI